MRTLPTIVTKLVNFHEGWIVGSSAELNEVARDIDVLIPFPEWSKAALLIPKDAEPNCFGGWKFWDEGKSVDVWPGDLGMFLSLGQCYFCWHPKSGIRFTTSKTFP